MLTKLKSHLHTLYRVYCVCRQEKEGTSMARARVPGCCITPSQANMAEGAHGVVPTEITEASVTARHVRPTKLGLRHSPQSYEMFCPLNVLMSKTCRGLYVACSRTVTSCKWLGRGTIALLSVWSGRGPLLQNCLLHHEAQFCT